MISSTGFIEKVINLAIKELCDGKTFYDDYFNGCPHCGAKNFYICNCCGRVVCYHGQEVVTCPNCGASSTLQTVESVDLLGGGF